MSCGSSCGRKGWRADRMPRDSRSETALTSCPANASAWSWGKCHALQRKDVETSEDMRQSRCRGSGFRPPKTYNTYSDFTWCIGGFKCDKGVVLAVDLAVEVRPLMPLRFRLVAFRLSTLAGHSHRARKGSKVS